MPEFSVTGQYELFAKKFFSTRCSLLSTKYSFCLLPYYLMPPLSSFNTMTLVMNMEQAFKEKFDFTFSEFIRAQDGKQLKDLAGVR